MFRTAMLMGLAVSLMTLVTTVQAADKERAKHQGTVVSAESGTLVMTTAGKEHSHTIGSETKITVDGKSAKLEDLKAGDKITVTTDGDKVVSVACKRPAAK